MIKLIALDLDNTLLEKDNEIRPRALALLRSRAAAGVVIAIATGRIYLSARKYAEEISAQPAGAAAASAQAAGAASASAAKTPAEAGPAAAATSPAGCKIICYNGSLVTEANGSPLFSAALPVETMRKVVSFCKARGLYCQFYKDHKILVEKVTGGTTIDPDLANTQAIEAGDFDRYDFSPSPKAMIVAPLEKVASYQAELSDYLKGEAYLAQSQPYLIEIMPKGVNKAHSLSLLCEKLGIDRSQVMACGDNTNDAEMIRWAGVGVAVANSVAALKAAASYVSSAERSLGVAEAIEKFCPL